MSNAIYPSALNAFLEGDLDLLSIDVRALLVTGDYTYDAADDFLDDISGGDIIAVSGNLTGKTVGTPSGGVFDASDITISSVGPDDPIRAVILYEHTGSDATSHLIAYLDTLSAGNPINFTPTGTDVTIIWPNGPTRIFRI